MKDFIPLAAMAALVIVGFDFAKYAKNKDWNGVFSIASVWIIGVLVVLLFAHSSFAHGVPVGDQFLDDLDFWAQVIVGLSVGSTGSTIYNFKKALDTSDSAKTPTLLAPKTE